MSIFEFAHGGGRAPPSWTFCLLYLMRSLIRETARKLRVSHDTPVKYQRVGGRFRHKVVLLFIYAHELLLTMQKNGFLKSAVLAKTLLNFQKKNIFSS